MTWRAARRWAGLVAAALSIAFGLTQALTPVPETTRTLRITALLEPLAKAPVPKGAAICLAMPASITWDDALPALLEAAWQRPDLHWTLDASDRRVGFVVAAPGARAPAGAREIWRADNLVLFRRAGS